MKKIILIVFSILLSFLSADSARGDWTEGKCERCWANGEYQFCTYSRYVEYDDQTCVLSFHEWEYKGPTPAGIDCPAGSPEGVVIPQGSGPFYPEGDYIGGCDDSTRQYDCSPAYSDAADFNNQFSDMEQWWYFTSDDGSGNSYKCMASYKNSSGETVEHTTSGHHSIDPAASSDCVSEEAFNAMNTDNCSQQENAFNTGIYTTYGDPDSTYGCIDSNGDGADDSTGAGCDVTASEIAEGEQGNCEGAECLDSGQCAEGAPAWKVNMVNMNIYMTDIPLWYDPPVGPSVRIQLSHNSQASAVPESPFGDRWTFNYRSYLEEDANDNVTVFMPDGRQDIFTSNGQGGYTKEPGVFSTLTKTEDNDFSLKLLNDTVYHYNNASTLNSDRTFLSKIQDPYNQSLTFGYNDNMLETITDALNRVTTLIDNPADGLIDRIDDPFGRSAHFFYTDGELTKIIDMGDYWTEFTYDANNYIDTLKNDNGTWRFDIEPSDGTISTNPYRSFGEPMGENYRITITDPLRNKEEYYSFGTFSWYVSPNDYVPHTAPDSNNYKSANKTLYILTESHETGKVSKIQSPGGGYIEYRDYDPITQNPKTIKDNHGHITRYTYNTNGRIKSLTDAKGNITTINYYADNIDVNDIRVDLINTAGNDDIILKSFTYNGSTHDIATVTERPGTAVSTTTGFTYLPNRQLDTITSAQDSSIEMVTGFVYDSVTHDLSEIRKNSNTVASFTYDNIGRVKTHTDNRGLTITYWEYSKLNMPTKITFPDTVFNTGVPESKFVNINYSTCCPRLIDSRTDRAGLTTSYAYDAIRRLKEVQSPEGTIRYDYDANGNLKILTDADGKATKFDYGPDNRLKKKTFEDNESINYEYDPAGLLTKIINARGIEIDYPDYDENHNLETINYLDETPDITYTYDDYDRLETMTDGTGTYQYGYDELNRLTTTDGPWDDDTITYGYDELGNIKSLSPQTGQIITYNYDYDTGYTDLDIGRLKDIQAGANTYTYNYTGVSPQVQSLTRPNGSTTIYDYNAPLKRLKIIDNRDSSAQTINKHEFTYNDFDIIDTETITTETPLDAFTAGFKAYDYNNLNQLTGTSSREVFTYDEDGNMTQGYTTNGYQYAATYDAENRLKTLAYNDGTNDHEIKYFYRGDSMLARIEEWDDTAIPGTMEKKDEVRFIRAGFLTIQERNESNTIEREYTWGIDMAGGIGGLLSLKQNSQDYSYLYDGKGNVMNVVKDIDESIAASYRYDIFGKSLKKTGTFDQPYRFSTKRYDEQTGQYYYGYRFHNPELGRWINRDPLGEAGGINLYGFVGNNPVSFGDPWGLDPRGWVSPYPSHGWNSTYTPAQDNSVLRCHVATHNDPVENLIGAAIVGGPLLGLAVAEVAPVAISAGRAVATTVLANPATVAVVQKQASDFISGFPSQLGPPPPSPAGYLGAFTGQAYSAIKSAIKNSK